MKSKHFLQPIIFFMTWLICSAGLTYAQSIKRGSWSATNPFHTNVFIKNYGQFNTWAATPEPVVYALNSGNKVFFSQNCVSFRLDKAEKFTEEAMEKAERHDIDEDTLEKTQFLVTMTWLGASPDATIEATGKADGYYTFGEKGYWDVQAEGYQKITYKNLYPHIDVEYIMPEEGGVKYSLILHPGADISMVKMSYSGDLDKISIDADGNIVIKTEGGDIIDHAPKSFIQGSGTPIVSSFTLKDNIVSFKLETNIDMSVRSLSIDDGQSTVIIDPWTVMPSQLATDYAAYDCDFDKYGNAYVSGGSPPYKTSKYNAAGTWLWTFTNPGTWAYNYSYYFYSKFCVLHHSGSIFMGEGLQSPGPSVMKVNSSGNVAYTSPVLSGNNEVWTMFYNACTNQLIGFGGGTSATMNLQQIADTMLSGSTIKSFNGAIGTCCNDITSAEMDYNGDFYALMSSYYNATTNVDGKLQKSLTSNNYNPPCAWDVQTGYLFQECFNYGIPGFGGMVETVRSNAVALNTSYVFTYDGTTLMAWNKSNGTNLGSIVVDAAYNNGAYRTHEGIAADECNNVYVGGNMKVHSFWFTGSSFIPGSSITTDINGEVYELSLDGPNNLLYVSGAGFLTVADAFFCPSANILQLTDTVNSCTGYACVNVTGGIPPYTYTWSNAAGNTNCQSSLAPGTYYLTVTDNSCILQAGYDTVVITGNTMVDINGDTLICAGDPTTLTASGSITYAWSPSTGLSATSGATVVATPSATITYTVTGTSSGCTNTSSIVITVITQPNVDLGNDTSICGVPSVVLDAHNIGATYLWSTGATTQTIIADTSGTFWVNIAYGSCSTSDTIVVSASMPVVDITGDTLICSGDPTTLTASGANTYTWTPATGLSLTTGTSVVATPSATITYTVNGLLSGCTDTESIIVTVITQPAVDLGNDTSLCGSPSILLDAKNPGADYLWSTGDTTQTITADTAGTFWVNIAYGSCTTSDTIAITTNIPPVVFIGNDTTLCPGDLILLDAGNPGTSYLWSTGATTQTISVPGPGLFWVRSSIGACVDYDTININVPTGFELGNELSLCSATEVVITVNKPATSYLWSTGDTTFSIIVDTAGLYWARAIIQTCPFSDTIAVVGGPTSLWSANTFTPNNDGINDFYTPVGEGIVEADLKIFTRWGDMVYESNDLSRGWDGRCDGLMSQLDVYVWVLDYRTVCSGERFLRRFGTVTLLK